MNDDSFDACLALVANRRRRRLLEQLRHTENGEMPIDDLVDQLHQADPDFAGERQMDRNQLTVELNHCHLPKLSDHGIVEHDQDRGTIEYRPDEQTEAVLDGLPEEPSLTNP